MGKKGGELQRVVESVRRVVRIAARKNQQTAIDFTFHRVGILLVVVPHEAPPRAGIVQRGLSDGGRCLEPCNRVCGHGEDRPERDILVADCPRMFRPVAVAGCAPVRFRGLQVGHSVPVDVQRIVAQGAGHPHAILRVAGNLSHFGGKRSGIEQVGEACPFGGVDGNGDHPDGPCRAGLHIQAGVKPFRKGNRAVEHGPRRQPDYKVVRVAVAVPLIEIAAHGVQVVQSKQEVAEEPLLRKAAASVRDVQLAVQKADDIGPESFVAERLVAEPFLPQFHPFDVFLIREGCAVPCGRVGAWGRLLQHVEIAPVLGRIGAAENKKRDKKADCDRPEQDQSGLLPRKSFDARHCRFDAKI